MSILLLAFPDCIAIMNILSAMSLNVLLLPDILFTKLIPSIMHADGNEIDSAGAAYFQYVVLELICQLPKCCVLARRLVMHVQNCTVLNVC